MLFRANVTALIRRTDDIWEMYGCTDADRLFKNMYFDEEQSTAKTVFRHFKISFLETIGQ